MEKIKSASCYLFVVICLQKELFLDQSSLFSIIFLKKNNPEKGSPNCKAQKFVMKIFSIRNYRKDRWNSLWKQLVLVKFLFWKRERGLCLSVISKSLF